MTYDSRSRGHLREKAPAYVALSYCCGNEPEIHEILIDNKVAKIRPNLWQALYHITTEREAVDREWRYIWCDAVCINQPNIEEKSEQIRGMYTTYRQATLVIAWLGIDRSGKYDERAANSKGIWKTFKDQNKTDVFEEEYFARMWIVQEAVAARNFVPMFGRTRITSLHLTAATRAAAPWTKNELTGPYRVLCFGFLHGFEGMADKLWTPIQKLLPDVADPNYMNLNQWLRFTEHSVCGHPKDRIFSILNLLPQSGREVLNCFFPDYELSLERIQLVALAYIRHDGGELVTLRGLSLRAKLLDAASLLRIRSKALRWELLLKARMSEASRAAFAAHNKWLLKNPLQHARIALLGHREADETWTQARIHTLSLIGSQPLAGELRAQTDLLKAKSWYIPPPADVQYEPEDLGDEADV